jgi:hypothetical protein
MTDSPVVAKFRSSMSLDYDAWHDGTGYDLSVLDRASAADKEIIATLVSPPKGWRDVEALAALGTETALMALRAAIDSDNAEVRTALTRYAPSSVSDDEKMALLVKALTTGAFYQDMTSALQQIEQFHSPQVIDALFRGLFTQTGDVACHFAAMLAFLHGKAKTTFDWDKRPLFLKFNTDNEGERRAAFVELCELLEVDVGRIRGV